MYNFIQVSYFEISQLLAYHMNSTIKRLVLSGIILSCTHHCAKAQAAILALIFGDKVASEKFHLSVDLGMNFSSLTG